MPSPLPAGRYRHFKGHEYVALGVARESETKSEFVVYHPADNPGDLWLRSLEMWSERVEHDGVSTPRFELLSAAEERQRD